MDVEQLVKQFQNGDISSYHLLFSAVMRILYTKHGEEYVQKHLAELYLRSKSGSFHGNFNDYVNWLGTILRNLEIDEHRYQAKLISLNENASVLSELDEKPDSLVQDIEQAEFLLNNMITSNRVSTEDKRIFLYHLSGKKGIEIAKLLDCSVSKVSRSLQKTKSLIRNNFYNI
jgi:RNA polymerase sigma factor (sigma-70 family)